MVDRSSAVQEIAGSSPGDRILRKKVIISWYLKFTRVLAQDAAWREIREIQTRRISGPEHFIKQLIISEGWRYSNSYELSNY